MRPWLSEDQIAALLTKTEPNNARVYIEDITWWREDMNFIFEWQNNILRTSVASE